MAAAIFATRLVQRSQVCGIPSQDPERFEELSARVVLHPGVRLGQLKSATTAHLQTWEQPRHWKTE